MPLSLYIYIHIYIYIYIYIHIYVYLSTSPQPSIKQSLGPKPRGCVTRPNGAEPSLREERHGNAW